MKDIQKIIDKMTLEEKIGQMCVPIFQSSYLTDDIKKCICDYHVGMLRYCPNAEYDGNSMPVGEPNKYLSAAQTGELLNSAQRMSEIPMFIAVDQEGSIRNDVNRNGAFAYSGHMSFGAANDTALTYEIAKATGNEFRAMGINLVQAPIVDVLTYEGRKTMKSASFGENVELVSEHALAMFRGFADANIAVMAKHFPGYGSVSTDAHKGLPEIKKSLEALEETDIKPMKLLIDSGVNGIMTGHVLTHCIDKEYPATLSAKMIKGYLRDKLSFGGIVETDALRMPAIHKKFGTARAAVLAILAGCDLLLLRGNLEHFTEGRNALINGVKDGTIPMQYIDAAVCRILEQKAKTGILDNPFSAPDVAEIVGCKRHKCLADTLAKSSVTTLSKKALPIEKDSKILVVCVEPQKLGAAMDDEQSIDMMYKATKRLFPNTDGITVALSPTDEELQRVTAACEGYDYVVLATCNALLYDSQARLCRSVISLMGSRTVCVAMDSPYDYEVLGEIDTYICTYGVAAASARVAAEILAGVSEGNAIVPVTLKF